MSNTFAESPGRRHIVTGQTVDLSGLNLPGVVLDIGGGGEGIIGRVLGKRVVAIDRLQRELDEAPDGPLKIEMDARDLKFADNAFDAATAFFSMLYIPDADHEQVLREVHRVLKPGAPFIIWDVAVPAVRPADKDVFVVGLEITLHDGAAAPSYGVRWEGKRQHLPHFETIATHSGFDVIAKEQNDQVFRLDLRRRLEALGRY
jgi:ubiquinone/menaquinone biosynthesis C-methylase UbiE